MVGMARTLQEHSEQVVWLPIVAAAGVFLLWPVEMVVPLPFMVEELFKGWLVWKGTAGGKFPQLQIVLLSGAMFALSELMLYVINAILVADLSALLYRLVLTVPMHVLTVIWLYWTLRRHKILFGVGLIVAMLMHWGFNQFVATFF
jgi:hypothetical protein